MDWFLATRPTNRSPPLVKPTTEGVVRAPSAFAMTWGSPPSMTAMQELVVPRSMPNTLLDAIGSLLFLNLLADSHQPPADDLPLATFTIAGLKTLSWRV